MDGVGGWSQMLSVALAKSPFPAHRVPVATTNMMPNDTNAESFVGLAAKRQASIMRESPVLAVLS
jgi:hypothetical protein